MSKESFITTKDNPFDYFKQFDLWLSFDDAAGYHTLEKVARTIRTASTLSEKDQEQAIEDCFDQIIKWHGDLYHKVYSNS